MAIPNAVDIAIAAGKNCIYCKRAFRRNDHTGVVVRNGKVYLAHPRCKRSLEVRKDVVD